MRIKLLYFAGLADQAGRLEETRDSAASSLADLYAEAQARHGFGWPRERLRVAVNGAFAAWADAPRDNDEVVFLPPVSGG